MSPMKSTFIQRTGHHVCGSASTDCPQMRQLLILTLSSAAWFRTNTRTAFALSAELVESQQM